VGWAHAFRLCAPGLGKCSAAAPSGSGSNSKPGSSRASSKVLSVMSERSDRRSMPEECDLVELPGLLQEAEDRCQGQGNSMIAAALEYAPLGHGLQELVDEANALATALYPFSGYQFSLFCDESDDGMLIAVRLSVDAAGDTAAKGVFPAKQPRQPQRRVLGVLTVWQLLQRLQALRGKYDDHRDLGSWPAAPEDSILGLDNQQILSQLWGRRSMAACVSKVGQQRSPLLFLDESYLPLLAKSEEAATAEEQPPSPQQPQSPLSVRRPRPAALSLALDPGERAASDPSTKQNVEKYAGPPTDHPSTKHTVEKCIGSPTGSTSSATAALQLPLAHAQSIPARNIARQDRARIVKERAGRGWQSDRPERR